MDCVGAIRFAVMTGDGIHFTRKSCRPGLTSAVFVVARFWVLSICWNAAAEPFSETMPSSAPLPSRNFSTRPLANVRARRNASGPVTVMGSDAALLMGPVSATRPSTMMRYRSLCVSNRPSVMVISPVCEARESDRETPSKAASSVCIETASQAKRLSHATAQSWKNFWVPGFGLTLGAAAELVARSIISRMDRVDMEISLSRLQPLR